MAEKAYSSILDAILASGDGKIDQWLDSRKPDWEDVGLRDAEASGDEVKGWAHKYVDSGLLDDMADGRHTQLPPTARSATLLNRLEEKENALPRIGMSPRRAGAHPKDYSGRWGDDDSLFSEVTMGLGEAESAATVEARGRSDEEAQAYVRQLLNQGVPPRRVAAQLGKLAELELLDKKDNMGSRFLRDNQGLLGMAYLEPNAFMDKSSPQYEREKVGSEGRQVFCPKCNKDVTPERRHSIDHCPGCDRNLGQMPKSGSAALDRGPGSDDVPGPRVAGGSADCVRQHDAWKAAGVVPRAASVKRVAACAGCAFLKGKSCALYHLPVVGSAEELRAVVNRLTPGVPAGSKRAALVALANRYPQRAEPAQAGGRPAQREARVGATALRGELAPKVAAGEAFDARAVEAMHRGGRALEEIYREGSRKVGSVRAGEAVKRFVASLRASGAKVSLSQIDCRFLKRKLGVGNAITGAAKCASCAYRQDMHCGLTGGTLLSFPGMGQTGKRAGGAAPTDPAAVSREYGLTGTPVAGDIELNQDREDGVTEWKNPGLDDTGF